MRVWLAVGLGLLLAGCGDSPPTATPVVPTAIVPTQTPYFIVITASPVPVTASPAPTGTPHLVPTHTPVPIGARPADGQAFAQFLADHYLVVAGHRLSFTLVRYFETTTSGIGTVENIFLEIGPEDYSTLLQQVPDKDMHDWGAQLLLELKTHWPGKPLGLLVVWTHYDSHLSTSTDCHGVGDYSAAGGGWFITDSALNILYAPGKNETNINTCRP